MHDHLKRGIIGALVDASNQSTIALVRKVYDLPEDAPPSRAKLQSVQRALRRLAKRGEIRETELYGKHGTRTWVLDKIKGISDEAIKAKAEAEAIKAKAHFQGPRLVDPKNVGKRPLVVS